MNVRINLLPHREMRRERRRKEFVVATVLTAACAAVAAFLVGVGIDRQIDAQRARNDFISAENARLDEQIREIATLRADIDGLQARKEAVESLQSNRTLPVHLMDELVSRVPDGTRLESIAQEEGKVTLVGLAQSNERISELLRNLARESPWLERPELVEIKAVDLPAQSSGKGERRAAPEGRRVYEFSLNALVRSGQADGARGAPGAGDGGTRQNLALGPDSRK